MSAKAPNRGLFGSLRSAISQIFGGANNKRPAPPLMMTVTPIPLSSKTPTSLMRASNLRPSAPLIGSPKTASPPSNQQTLREMGFAAAGRSDWTAADVGWADLRRKFPDDMDGWLHGAWALLQLGRPTEGLNLLQEALVVMPDQNELLVGLGYHASFRKQWAEAAECWQRVRLSKPDAPDGWVHGATALFNLNRVEEAEALLRQAITYLPDRYDLRARQAYLAGECGDWILSQKRWQALDGFFPNNPEIKAALQRTSTNLTVKPSA